MQIGKDYIGVGVGAVILNENYEILLVKRKKKPEDGKWSIPGGKVEFLEDAELALIREVKEELGIDAEIKMLLGVTSHILPEEKQHWLAPCYLIKVLKGEIRNMEPESHSDMKWFHLNEMPDNLTLTAEKAFKYLNRYNILYKTKIVSDN